MSNTLIRAISGTIFLIIMTGGIILHPVIYCLIMLFAIIVMNWEYLNIAGPGKQNLHKTLTLAASATLFVSTYAVAGFGLDPRILILNGLVFIAIYISLLYSKDQNRPDGPMLAGSVIYTALPFSLINFVVFDTSHNYDYTMLLSFFFILWASDVGAYVFGMTFGQKNGHKLFPSISPNKSWEGFFGGLFTALLTGFIIYRLNFWNLSLTNSIVVGLIINIFGVFGDLTESMFKRKYGVKDSGNIMPGHGGLLDRFDGALLAFPAALAYLEITKLF